MERPVRSRAPFGAALAFGLAGVLAFAGSGQSPVGAAPTSGVGTRQGDVVSEALAALRAHAGVLGFALDGLGAQGLGLEHAVVVTDVVKEADGAAHVRMHRTFHGLP